MFRRRLTIALSVLAAAVVVEGLGAAAMLDVGERQVQRGRVASDIQLGFVELSATKQRLRTWVAQLQQGAGADPAVRDALHADMRRTVERLQRLSKAAIALDGSSATRAEHIERQDALAVLASSVEALVATVEAATPLTEQTDARAAWAALSRLFDQSRGRDLRQLIADSIAREGAAVQRERAAADATLAWMRGFWIAMAGTLAFAALLAAVYFTRALRKPLDLLTRGAQSLQQGQLQHRIPLDGNDEFSDVARSMNAMAAQLDHHREREAQQRQELERLVDMRTAELQEALQAMQRADARRRQLFADISHELRTPTTAIRGEAEVTLRGRDRPVEEYRATLDRIVDTSRQLGLVIDDLLAIARSDIDALSLVRRPVSLAEPLGEALAQISALALDRRVECDAPVIDPDQWPLWADAPRLRQLFAIVLDNAVRYSHPGGRVTVAVAASAQDASMVEVRIEDQGIGIRPDEIPQVFERHFRGEGARQHRPDGSGLGLPIARALATAHGGSVLLSSEPGRGTQAVVRLPLRQPVGARVA